MLTRLQFLYEYLKFLIHPNSFESKSSISRNVERFSRVRNKIQRSWVDEELKTPDTVAGTFFEIEIARGSYAGGQLRARMSLIGLGDGAANGDAMRYRYGMTADGRSRKWLLFG